MTWYAAHLVMFVEFKSGPQSRYPVWENVVLISGTTEDEAFRKAERRGQSDEGDDDGSFRWGKRPARWVFAGVRKLTECQGSFERSADGVEVSYTEFELPSRAAVKKLAEGKPIDARFNDLFATVPSDEKREPRRARKRPA